MTRLAPRFPSAALLLAGDGPLRGQLEALAGRLGIAARVHFLGHCDDVRVPLGAADLLVLPSLWEGMPLALLEGMACRLPVVASDVSGSRELVVPGRPGLLVPPGDAEALAEALEELLTHPARARALGEAGRKRVEERFGGRAQARRYRALFEGLQ